MRLRLPKHVHGFIDRHGKPRYYLRRPGFKSIALPGRAHSAEFEEAYAAAMAGIATRRQIGAGSTLPGSVNEIAIDYMASPAWAMLKPGTQKARATILQRFREEHGDRGIAGLTERPLLAILSKRPPHSARNWLKALRGLCKFALGSGKITSDPTAGIKLPAAKSKGFHSWTDAEIAQFEKRWPVGTKPRLALGLLLYTAQRRGDVAKLGPQHIRAGRFVLVQQKTGTEIDAPIHPELRRIISATASGHLAFLVTQQGRPFSCAGFGNWFADRCREAGLPDHCRAHGLRKAACRRMAEAGCTAPQIAALSGHLSLSEIARYISAFNRKMAAEEAVAKVVQAFPSAHRSRTAIRKPNPEGLQKRGKKR